MIHEVIIENQGYLNISKLCELAGVSRSGYYSYENREKNKDINPKEIQDKKDFELILEVYKRKGIKKGARTITMILAHDGHPMNLKKVRRLMKKFGLFVQ